MNVRGIRGAVTAARNTRAEIASRTRLLLRTMIRRNGVRPRDVAAAFFTVTPDLDAGFPAAAARGSGGAPWARIPMMCSVEIGVPSALPRVIRVMLLVNTETPPERIEHPFLGGAGGLRPDLSSRRHSGRRRPVRSGAGTEGRR